MKQILLIIFLFAFSNIYAQLELTPNDEVKVDTLNLSDEGSNTKIHYSLINTGPEDVTLRWCIEQVSGPEEWEPQLCVNPQSGGCFSWGVLCNVDASIGLDYPFVIPAGDTSLLDLGIKPNGAAGCGAFKIEVTPYFAPTILVTANYNFEINMSADCLTVGAEDLEKANVEIFPNPANNKFTISENDFIKEIEIIDAVGRSVLQVNYNNGNTIDISSLSNGIYFVKMSDKDGQVFQSERLIKQ